MKIIRLKGGYAIRCSDSEFEALVALVEHGQSDFCDKDQWAVLSPSAKVAMSKYFMGGAAMAVNEDRRKWQPPVPLTDAPKGQPS